MATHPKVQLPEAPSENEAANQLFRERIRLLPGILRVEEYENVTGQPYFWIYVRPEDRETEYSIYNLEAEIYQRYQRAYLDVWVKPEADVTDTDL